MADNTTTKQPGAPAGAPARQQQQRSGGRNQRRRQKSRYGTQMEEKQTLKSVYGIREAQLRRYYEEAQKSGEATGPHMINLLERRLDNAVFRAGWAPTRRAARQIVSHALLEVNGRGVNIASLRLKVGDVVSVKESKRKKALFGNFEMKMQSAALPSWIALKNESFSFSVEGQPSAEEAGLGVDIRSIVEYYAR